VKDERKKEVGEVKKNENKSDDELDSDIEEEKDKKDW
jgi:hypothetical protein